MRKSKKLSTLMFVYTHWSLIGIVLLLLLITDFSFRYFYKEKIYNPTFESTTASILNYLDQWKETLISNDLIYHNQLGNILISFREFIKKDPNKSDKEISQFLYLFQKENIFQNSTSMNWYIIENGIISRSNYPKDIGLNIPNTTPGYWNTLENIEVGEILIDSISFEIKTNLPRMYGYYKFDSKTIFEIGIALEEEIIPNLLERINSIVESIPYVEKFEAYSLTYNPFSDKFDPVTEEDILAFKKADEQKTYIIRNPNKRNPILYGDWRPDSRNGKNIHIRARYKLSLDFRSIVNFKRNFLIISNSLIIAVFLLLIFLNFKTAKSLSNPINDLIRRMKNFQMNSPENEVHTKVFLKIKEVEQIEEMYLKMTERVGHSFDEQAEQADKLHKDIKKKDKLEKKLKTEVSIDYLTGIYNRKYINKILESELKRARLKSSNLTICYIDIDQFKDINDNYGHLLGDKLLQFITKTFSAKIRKNDSAGRVGGDEFLLIFPTASVEDAGNVMKRIANSLDEEKPEEFSELTISISYGLIEYDINNPLSADELIKTADIEMYKNKKLRVLSKEPR